MKILRDYQTEGLAAIEVELAKGKRPLLVLPTGAGKMVVGAEAARRVARTGGRTLFLQHRQELIEQAQEQLLDMAPDLTVGIVKAERREYDAQIVLASIQTVWRPEHLEKLGTGFQLAIVDEAHHATADSWRAVIEALRGVPLFGMTATPFRADDSALADIFSGIAYQKRIIDMIPDYLSDLRGQRIRVQADFNQLHTVHGEVNQGEAGAMLMNANAPAEIAKAYTEHASGRKTLVFTPTVEVAEAVARAFVKAGVAAECISDQCSADERKGIIARLRSGQTTVVSNCAILTEGFDCPDVSCIIIARPTKSKVLYIQMIGRGTRKAPDKVDCLVLDTTGASERHDLHTLGSLFGVPGMKPDETVTEALERQRVEREHAELNEKIRGILVSAAIEMMRKSRVHWVSAPEGDLHVLGLGDGNVRLVRERDGKWLIVKNAGPKGKYAESIVTRGVADLSDATSTAEALAKSSVLTDSNAEWRTRPIDWASSQVEHARKLKIHVHAGMTRGQLSDKMSIAFARRNEDFRTGRKQARTWGYR